MRRVGKRRGRRAHEPLAAEKRLLAGDLYFGVITKTPFFYLWPREFAVGLSDTIPPVVAEITTSNEEEVIEYDTDEGASEISPSVGSLTAAAAAVAASIPRASAVHPASPAESASNAYVGYWRCSTQVITCKIILSS